MIYKTFITQVNNGNMIYKTFITQVNNGKNFGTGILCEDFDSFEDAKHAGEKNVIFKESFFTIRLYIGNKIIIGGPSDTGFLVYESKKPEIFIVEGYDKDGDVYETLGIFSEREDCIAFEDAMLNALELGLIGRKCRNGTIEPFDSVYAHRNREFDELLEFKDNIESTIDCLEFWINYVKEKMLEGTSFAEEESILEDSEKALIFLKNLQLNCSGGLNQIKAPVGSEKCICPKCSTRNEIILKRKNTVVADIVYCWHCGQAMRI